MTWWQIEKELRKQIGIELASPSPSWDVGDFKDMMIAAGIAYDKAKDERKQARDQAFDDAM